MEYTDKKEIVFEHEGGPVEIFYKFDRAVNIRKVSLLLKGHPMACDVLSVHLLDSQNRPLMGFDQTDPVVTVGRAAISQHFIGWKLIRGKGSLVVTFSNLSESVSKIIIEYEVI